MFDKICYGFYRFMKWLIDKALMIYCILVIVSICFIPAIVFSKFGLSGSDIFWFYFIATILLPFTIGFNVLTLTLGKDVFGISSFFMLWNSNKCFWKG